MIGSRQAHMGAVSPYRGGGGAGAWNANTFYTTGQQVTFGGHTWQANTNTASGHAPQGVGDGSTSDRNLLLNACNKGWGAMAGTTGGSSGATYVVTTAADSGTGSLRAGLESPSPLWIIFNGNYSINTLSRIDIRPNKTVDGRGRNITVSGQGMGRYKATFNGDPEATPPNLIVAYINFDNIWIDTASSVAFATGGNTESSTGSGDRVYVHHCSFFSIADSSALVGGYVGTNISRSTVDWCKTGPNPDQDLFNQAGGFIAASANAASDIFTATNHPFWPGQEVQLFSRQGQVFPGGFVKGKYAYVRDVTTNSFRLSLTRDNTVTPSDGGPLQDVTSNGSCWVVNFDDQSPAKVPAGKEGRNGDPYLSGKGLQWGVNHGSDATTGDFNGYLRATVTLCDFRYSKIRQPKFRGAWAHLYNNRVHKWGDPDGGAGAGHEFPTATEALCEFEIFDPYQTGETHNYSNYLPVAETLTADGSVNEAILSKTNENAKIKTTGLWLSGSAGTSTNPSALQSDANQILPTWLPVPYSYSPVTDRNTLAQMLDRGAGNIQPWTYIS